MLRFTIDFIRKKRKKAKSLENQIREIKRKK